MFYPWQIIALAAFCAVVILLIVWLLIQRSRHGRAKASLRTSEERYLLALAGSTDGPWDWDLIADTVFYSDRFKEILGSSSGEFPWTMDSFRSRLHPEDAEPIWAAIQSHLHEHAPYKVEYRLRTQSGEHLWFLARGQAIWNSEGKAVRVSGSIQDITERKQGELNLKAALSEIKQLKTNWRSKERICRKKSNRNTIMRTLLVKVMRSIIFSIKLNKLPPPIRPFSF